MKVFPDICSNLVDKKVNLVDKLTLLKQLKTSESSYDQVIVDWILSTVEFVSNTDKYIALNSAEINELLIMLTNRLKVTVDGGKEIILRPSIFDVLVRFFSPSSTFVNYDTLVSTWHVLVQNNNWKENLTSKSMVSSLAWFCEFYISDQGTLVEEVVLSVVEKLSDCYLKYIRSQYISTKVFTRFCSQLLIKLMSMDAACSNIGEEYRNICSTIRSNISNIFAVVLCTKEQLASLRQVLKVSSSVESPNKKAKIDDTSVQLDNKDAANEGIQSDTKKNEEISADSKKDSKGDLHFQVLFDELLEVNQVICANLLKALPKFYETLLCTSRSSQSSLTNVEEMLLLLRLKECLTFGLDATSMTSLEELLQLVIEYDIYHRSEDLSNSNPFHKWMAELVDLLISHCDRNCAAVFLHRTLKIMLKILTIDHIVLEPVHQKIWNICLNAHETQHRDLEDVKESLLCEMLATYENLHQLDRLCSTFTVASATTVAYPKKFHEGFQKSVSTLLTVQVNGILDVFLSKLTAVCAGLKSGEFTETLCSLQHETYLLCYLVLTSASVVPANGYRKPELELFIKKLRMLKSSVKELVDFTLQHSGSEDQLEGEEEKEVGDVDEIVSMETSSKVLNTPTSWTNIAMTSCKMMPPGFMGQYPRCVVTKEFKVTVHHIQALIQYGINNIFSVLKEFSLVDDGDEDLVVFDGLLNISSWVGNDNWLCKYLVSALCFDHISGGTATDDLITTAKQIFEDACLTTNKRMERWNRQILCISEVNFNDALVKLFGDNLPAILSLNDKILISSGLNLLWMQLLYFATESGSGSTSAKEDDDSLALLQSLHCYNSLCYQTSLLTAICNSLTRYLVEHETNNVALLSAEVGIEKMIEIRDEFMYDVGGSGDVMDTSDTNDENIDASKLLDVLKLIQKLPVVYFTEENLFLLSVAILYIWRKMRGLNHPLINRDCVKILRSITEVYVVANHKFCYLPTRYIFDYNISYAIQHEMTPDDETHLIALCVSAIKIAVKYGSKDQDVTTDICNRLLDCLRAEQVEKAVDITAKIIEVLSDMLSEPTKKSRNENATYYIVLTLGETLVNLIRNLHDAKHTSHTLFSIFANICKITQHAQVGKGSSSTLKFLEDKLVDVFPVVRDSINTLLETCVDSTQQHIQVIDFLYSSSHEFTLRLRKSLQQDDADMILTLLRNAERGLSPEKYGHSIAGIVLRVDSDELPRVLKILTEKLISELKEPERKWILKVWHILLTSKWEKEQRIALWEHLPKVILACVHMTKLMKTADDVILLLQLLTSAIDIGKNSLMSQYMNSIYHVFILLPKKVQESEYGSFVHQFEQLYHLASKLLFHHQSVVFFSLHAYIRSVHCIFELLCSYSSSAVYQTEDSRKCCERMARLYRELGSHKAVVAKYSPFIISRFIRTSSLSSLSSTDKKLIESGIYCIMDTCSDTEFSFLGTLEKGDKEYFKMLKNNYDKHHKFTGKS